MPLKPFVNIGTVIDQTIFEKFPALICEAILLFHIVYRVYKELNSLENVSKDISVQDLHKSWMEIVELPMVYLTEKFWQVITIFIQSENYVHANKVKI